MKTTPWLSLIGALLTVAAIALMACEDSSGGSEGEGEGEGESESEGEGEAESEGEGEGEGEACGGTTQCTNGSDDDGDGFIDGFDPECTGACDNDEGTFQTDIPGDNMDATWQDCFFDGNSGGGDDCRYHSCCLLGDVNWTSSDGHVYDCTESDGDAADYDPAEDCDDSCTDYCEPGVGPGCDCFGCCTVWKDGELYTVVTNPSIAPDCDYDVIDDPELCPPCEQSTDCGNDCDPENCELCPGMLPGDLPESCAGGESESEGEGEGEVNVCDNGMPCGSDSDCSAGGYCQTGCCVAIIE